MNKSQWIALAAGVTLIIACFMPWVIILNPPLTISGVDTIGTRFGKPAYNHFIFTALITLFSFIPKIWAKRFNLFFASLNVAWAIKNFSVISRCEAGECPQKQTGLYLVLFSSIVLLITVFFPNIKIAQQDVAETGEE